MNNRTAMKQKLMAYFNAGCKKEASGIGIELEHFLIDKQTLRSYGYDEGNGQKDLLNKLMTKGWRLLSEENGQPLGLEKEGSTITLEPGGQVEISLRVFEEISALEKAYQHIIDEINGVLVDNQILVATGYHPKSRIEELPLLPKERYHHMFEYFKTHGEQSHYMMKGTAATQVAIDYKDEEDFIKKYRVANFIGPILSKVFDSTAVFEGEIVKGHNKRIAIWNETDPVRTKYPDKSFEGVFGFEEYADYLLKTPPIFTKIGDEYVFTEDQPLEDVVEMYDVESIDVEHIVGMVFPDVRLKTYIEIRMADALPSPYVFALAAIVKGIFYNEETLNRYYEFAKKYSQEDIESVNELLLEELDFTYKDISMNWFTMKVLLDAKASLESSEQESIDLLFEQLNEEGSYSNKLKRLYEEDIETYLEWIKVG